MRRLILAVLVLALGCFAAPFSDLGAQDDLETYEIQGVASEVDAVGSLLVVNAVNPRGHFQSMRFIVPDETKIYQGTEEVRLNDIDIGDSLTVTYYKDAEGNLKTTQITDNNLGNNQM